MTDLKIENEEPVPAVATPAPREYFIGEHGELRRANPRQFRRGRDVNHPRFKTHSPRKHHGKKTASVNL